MTNKIKIIFSPEFFDNFDGDQEDIDEIVDTIKRMFEDDDYIKTIIDEYLENSEEEESDQLFNERLSNRRLH